MTALLELVWLIPLLPLLAFVLIGLFAHRNGALSRALAVAGIVAALALAQLVFWSLALAPDRTVELGALRWLPVGPHALALGVWIDPTALVLLFSVPLACALIALYSAGSIDSSRYFAIASLLVAAMLGALLVDNLLLFLVCLGVMDGCVYLLIDHRAGLKTFLTLKVGDAFLLLALALLHVGAGSLAYRDVLNPDTLRHLAATPFFGTHLSLASAIALLLLAGAVVRCAQFPLHVWLPDALAVSPPVSALVNATVLPAGVLLILRAFPLLQAAASVHFAALAAIGAFSAVLGALIAAVQDDVGRALGFSTVSQLGCVMVALGVGATGAAILGLAIHTLIRTLLFLGAGSVIRGMALGGQHAPFDPADVMNMGGLRSRLPRTFWTFVCGGLALAALPLVTAGFWPASEIVVAAYGANLPVFWVLAATAAITAFYAARLICLIFGGWPRTEAAVRATESTPAMTAPLIVLAVLAIGIGWVGIPDGFPVVGGLIPDGFRRLMSIAPTGAYPTTPLLATVACGLGGLFVGWLIYGRRPLQSGQPDRVEVAFRWLYLGWLFEAVRDEFYLDRLYHATFVRGVVWLADALDLVDRRGVDGAVGLLGRAGVGLAQASDRLDTAIDRRVDSIGRAGRLAADGAAAVDRALVRLVDGLGSVAEALGALFRPVQAGRVQYYLLLALTMILVLIAILVSTTGY